MIDRNNFTEYLKTLYPSVNDTVLLVIYKKYINSSRHYHNIDHIISMLEIVEDKYLDQFTKDEIFIIKTSIIFHDVIYDPLSKKDDITESIKYFRYFNGYLKLDKKIVDEIVYCILDTSHKEDKVITSKSAFVRDLDIYVGLGQSNFLKNFKLIQKEFYNISAPDFYKGRKEFLEKLLEKRKLYYSRFFRNEEAKTRQNIDFQITYIDQKLKKI